jgi:hypothetical protein
MKAIQIDNFFENIDVVYNECKKLTFYSKEEHPLNKDRITSNWPGKRTEELGKCNPILKYFLLKYYSINNLIAPTDKLNFYVHARFDEDLEEEWIHQDHGIAASLIYLSPTNLQSGTKLYSGKPHKMINDFKFVQNRLIQYDANYFHEAYGNHGTNLDSCRLTINVFTY